MMAWLLTNPQIYNTFASLGVTQGDTYIVSDDCLAILDDILMKLAQEDQNLRTFRRAVGFGQNIRKDLLPLLVHVKDNANITDSTKIIDRTIKILVNLTIPVECLLPIETIMCTDVGRHTFFELNRLLITGKEAFTDSRGTKAVVDHIRHFVEKDTTLDMDECDSINNAFLLLRNILHIPETRTSSSALINCTSSSGGGQQFTSMQNQILWNLFTQSIDKVIINLMASPQKMCWSVTLVQLIALMYKDQHIGTLQKLLNIWFEASLSDSSEDNESNTSPQKLSASGDSSPMLTSDPTSDSSDNGSGKSNESSKLSAAAIAVASSGGSADGINSTSVTSKHVSHVNHVISARSAANQCRMGKTAASSSSSAYSSSSNGPKSMGTTGTNSATSTSANSIRSNDEETSSTSTQNTEPKTNTEMSFPQNGAIKPKQQGNGVNNNGVETISSQAVVQGKRKEYPSSQSEVSDYGYGTQVENQESVSTSSNEDEQLLQQKPIHQKPRMVQMSRYINKPRPAPTVQMKNDIRRKKLVKRSKTHIINMKGLLHHTPTDEDISNILKEFTVDFLLKGYKNLVFDLHNQLIFNVHVHIDTSHFFWLVTYFLKFATQLELDLEHIQTVLRFDIISYLIFQGIFNCEEFELNVNKKDIDLKPCLRRMHLVVTAIKEFVQAVNSYLKISHLTKEDREHMINLQKQISETEDLKCLFILLLRKYDPRFHSKEYLQDLIVTNHILLLFMEQNLKGDDIQKKFSLMEHLKPFATVEIMRNYGLALQDFQNNGEFVNNCIFTMMHHIAGDVDNVMTLFQPNILKTFSQIWETDYEICDDWSDLIEYVIHKFINSPPASPQASTSVSNIIPDDDMQSDVIQECERWTAEDIEHLEWFYMQSIKSSNVVEEILLKYAENGITNISRFSVIKKLLEQNLIDGKQYEDLIKGEQEIEIFTDILPAINYDSVSKGDGIKMLKENLVKENKGKLILWLQNILVEACYVKLLHNASDKNRSPEKIMEPIPYCYETMNLSIPVVPWTCEQDGILLHQPFILLLHKLGFLLPADTGKKFVRIPNFWTADYLFSVAQQLGPIDVETLKFDVNLLHKNDAIQQKPDLAANGTSVSAMDCDTPSLVQYTPMSHPLSIAIPKNTSLRFSHPVPVISICNQSTVATPIEKLSQMHMDCSTNTVEDFATISDNEHNYETDSVASDLTRMYVSDEEEKQITD